jgi:hypothetical protein
LHSEAKTPRVSPIHASGPGPERSTLNRSARRGAQRFTLTALLVLLLASGAAAARWLTRSELIYGWDTVNYILAQQRYDLLAHQPHPPGSFYYVLLARAASLLTGDAHEALLLLGALSGAVLVVGLFLLGRELGGDAGGLLAAGVGASAPLFWFFGSVGLNYGPAGAVSVFVALGCVRLWRGQDVLPSALLAGAALGLLGGFRPTDVAFLGPAFLASLARGVRLSRGGCKAAAAGAAVAAILTLGWLVPNAVSAGGLTQYVDNVRAQAHLLENTSILSAGWPAVSEALYTHRRSLESAVGAAWVLVAAALWNVTRSRRVPCTPPKPDALPGPLLALLILPALLFYLLVHFNSPGYALTYAGVLVAALAAFCARSLPVLRSGGGFTTPHSPLPTHRGRSACLAAVLLVNGALFFFGWPGARDEGQLSISGREIADHDRYYRELRAYLDRRHGSAPVRVLAVPGYADGQRVVQALLPDRPGQVARAVESTGQVAPELRRLGWLTVMTPEEVEAEGRPVYAVYRAPWMASTHRALFGDRLEPDATGPGHVVWRLGPRREADGPRPGRQGRPGPPGDGSYWHR